MATVRKTQAGFTLTETMVVVVILSILAAVSAPLLLRDNTARKGRDWAQIIAQSLQRARFEALGNRTNVHVVLYRTHIDTYRQDNPIPPSTTTNYVLLSSIQGPAVDNEQQTVAIWDANTTRTVPRDGRVLGNGNTAPTSGTSLTNDIIFTSLGSTVGNASWWIYVRNEFLQSNHPDASFLVTVTGLTGYVSTHSDKVVLK